eukprot:11211275-Lingulodinium_polyedra.AAC.1
MSQPAKEGLGRPPPPAPTRVSRRTPAAETRAPGTDGPGKAGAGRALRHPLASARRRAPCRTRRAVAKRTWSSPFGPC